MALLGGVSGLGCGWGSGGGVGWHSGGSGGSASGGSSITPTSALPGSVPSGVGSVSSPKGGVSPSKGSVSPGLGVGVGTGALSGVGSCSPISRAPSG